MLKKTLLVSLVLLLVLGVMVVGYGQKAEQPAKKPAEKKLDLPRGFTVATSAIGGTFHIWATGWGQVMNAKTGMDVAIETGGGPVTNVGLIQEKRVDLGLVTMGPAYEGFTGTGWAKGKKHDSIRGMFPLFVSYLHWWALPNSGIKTIYDFKGKVILNGPAGSSPYLFGQRVFDELGIKPSRVTSGHYSDANQQLRDGMLGAVGTFSGLPNPAADEMVQTEKAVIIPVGADSEKIARKYGITVGTMKAGIYKTLKEDVTTLTMWNTIIANKDTSEDLIYHLVKTTFKNLSEVHLAHAAGKEILLENVPMITAIPLHAGAIRYYEEIGLKLPGAAYPPEYKK